MKENRLFLFVGSRENVWWWISEVFNLSFHPEKNLFLQTILLYIVDILFFYKKCISLNVELYIWTPVYWVYPRDIFFYIIS